MTTKTAYKIVAPDFTTRDGAYTWPFPGTEVVASYPFPSNTGPCPRHEGDGLCLALTVRGACSGGQALSNAVGLLIEYDEDDVLGADLNKLRVSRCTVTGVFDPMKLIRLGLQPDLRDANLRGANLRDANLRGANLHGANLRYADLRHADLQGANLQGINLQGTNLRGADLRDANLRYADLRHADLRHANLRYADR